MSFILLLGLFLCGTNANLCKMFCDGAEGFAASTCMLICGSINYNELSILTEQLTGQINMLQTELIEFKRSVPAIDFKGIDVVSYYCGCVRADNEQALLNSKRELEAKILDLEKELSVAYALVFSLHNENVEIMGKNEDLQELLEQSSIITQGHDTYLIIY